MKLSNLDKRIKNAQKEYAKLISKTKEIELKLKVLFGKKYNQKREVH